MKAVPVIMLVLDRVPTAVPMPLFSPMLELEIALPMGPKVNIALGRPPKGFVHPDFPVR